jgi:hypothetical protein
VELEVLCEAQQTREVKSSGNEELEPIIIWDRKLGS